MKKIEYNEMINNEIDKYNDLNVIGCLLCLKTGRYHYKSYVTKNMVIKAQAVIDTLSILKEFKMIDLKDSDEKIEVYKKILKKIK